MELESALYISDFDPAGRSRLVAVARKIEFALRDSDDLDVRLQPIVLTEEQCQSYCLPRTPIKDTEARAPKFEARFGAGATELDVLEALHLGELARIVKAEIQRYIDPDHRWKVAGAAVEYHQSLKETTSSIHQKYQQEVDNLKQKYCQLVRQFEEFKEEARGTFDNISRDLQGSRIEPFESPEHRPADEPADGDVLFDSRRDYLSQADAYHRWQGKL